MNKIWNRSIKNTLPFNVFTATSTDVTPAKGAIDFRDSVINISGVSGSIKSANFARVASSLLSRGLNSSKLKVLKTSLILFTNKFVQP